MRVYMPREDGIPLSFPHTKPHWVADSLDEMGGPFTGIIELPNRLDWSTHPTYDLSDRVLVCAMYSNVVREAASSDDIAFLNRELLLSVWSKLNIPDWIRVEWERHHEELRCL